MLFLILINLALAGTGWEPSETEALAPPEPKTLLEARKPFKAKFNTDTSKPEPLDEPPPKVFEIVKYDSSVGKLGAYLTPDPGDKKKHPAIVWITGGDCNSIGDVWSEVPKENDQTASAFRKAGIVMMFPSLRGGNDNPGDHEGFYGEVEDVIAAREFLAKVPYVDPDRIYLGGHSTGGTLVMLVAESSSDFRGVFSFGPVADVRGYSKDYTPFNTSDINEIVVRSPVAWMPFVHCPLFVIEGTESPGNIDSLKEMREKSKNSEIRFLAVKGVDHFSILSPVNAIIAAKILADDGPKSNLELTEAELNRPATSVNKKMVQPNPRRPAGKRKR